MSTSTKSGWWNSTPFWLLVAIAISFIALYPTLNNGWVNWDDEEYVLNNPMVHEISASSISTMFTTSQVQATYTPLVLLSWALDYSIAGADAQVFHTTNLLYHLLNIALVFWLILLLVGRPDVAGITALLFGMHPMHLEVVAWISARKDLVYALFYLLGLIAYVYYIKRPERKVKYYVLCLLFFVLSLFSKGIAVTFPVILLTIDYWMARSGWRKLLVEKLPFFALSIGFGLLAVAMQQEGAAMEALGEHSFIENLFVGAYGLVLYCIKVMVPYPLSGFHPYPYAAGAQVPWYIYAAIVPALGLLFLTYKGAKKHRVIGFGMAFFLLSIAPLLQVLSFGSAVIAERYTYLAYIGLFLIIAMAFRHWFQHRTHVLGKVLLVVYLGAMAFLTFTHSFTWKSGESLWSNTIQHYPNDYFAFGNRGLYYTKVNQPEKALADYRQCVGLNPQFHKAYINMGYIEMNRKNYDVALQHYGQALAIAESDLVYLNIATIKFKQGNYEAAIADFTKAISLNANNAQAWYMRGESYSFLMQYDAAMTNFNKAIALGWQQPGVFWARGSMLYQSGKLEQALTDLNAYLQQVNNDPEGFYLRGLIQLELGNLNGALADFNQCLALQPQHLEALNNRGLILLNTNKQQEALSDFNRAIKVDPNFYLTYLNRALLYSIQQQHELAIADFSKTIALNPNYCMAYYELAKVYRALGDSNKGKTILLKAQQVGCTVPQELLTAFEL